MMMVMIMTMNMTYCFQIGGGTLKNRGLDCLGACECDDDDDDDDDNDKSLITMMMVMIMTMNMTYCFQIGGGTLKNRGLDCL